MEIGNGGFGPGYGFLKLVNNSGKSEESSLDLYRSLNEVDPEDEVWCWPEEYMPIIDWGCAILSCVDCDTGEVLFFDPNNDVEDMDNYFFSQSESIKELLTKWCDGVNLWKEIYGD